MSECQVSERSIVIKVAFIRDQNTLRTFHFLCQASERSGKPSFTVWFVLGAAVGTAFCAASGSLPSVGHSATVPGKTTIVPHIPKMQKE